MATHPGAIIVSLIEEHGMREHEIVSELKTLGIEVTQATINRLRRGRHRTTRFEIGMGLLKLHERFALAADAETSASSTPADAA